MKATIELNNGRVIDATESVYAGTYGGHEWTGVESIIESALSLEVGSVECCDAYSLADFESYSFFADDIQVANLIVSN